MAPAGGAQGGGDQGAGGVRAARRSRERARRERLAGWRRQRKETKRRSLVGKGGELLIRPLVDGARLSSLGEKRESENCSLLSIFLLFLTIR